MSPTQLNDVLQDLRDDDAAVREQAAARLAKFSSTERGIDETRQLLRAAGQTWPPDEKTDHSDALVAAAFEREQLDYGDTVIESFPRFSERARWRVVQRLVQAGNALAAQTFADLVKQYAKQGLAPPASLDGFAESPSVAKQIIPALLEDAGHDELGYQIQLLALRAAQSGHVSKAELAPFAGTLLQIYRSKRDRMRNLEEPTGDDWIWTDEYADDRAHATLLLDLMGYLPSGPVLEALQEATTSRDPRVQLFAALSLLRHRREAPAVVIEAVATSPEVRNWLYGGLASLKRLDLFPERFASQEAFAEANMVEWLTYPTELGRTPHEIQLMTTFEDDKGEHRYYLFRFRTHAPHWAAKDGWMAGLSGPFEIAVMPTTSAGGSTFSTFTRWNEKSPREHFESISGLISDHWKHRAAEIEAQDL
jgi:hypothetical protein